MSPDGVPGNGPIARSVAPGVRTRGGEVLRVVSERPGRSILAVQVDGDAGESEAIVYHALMEVPRAGARVVLNTTAVHLGLGTGGRHIVIAAADGTDREAPDGPRVMKARYLPEQVLVSTVEELHPELFGADADLGGVPVVCAPLHSMIGPIAAGAAAAGARQVVYLMTDGAALPGALSDLVPELRAAGLLSTWGTAGQAFGGEWEAVTLWSGLLAAVRLCEADVVIVADGPGNLGTETAWGVSALASGQALDAVQELRGQAIAALRISFADPRARHRGVSHHSLQILGRIARREVNVAVPGLPDEERSAIWEALRAHRLEERHRLVEADGRPALERLQASGIAVMTMGRGIDDDPAFFLGAGAAGVLAGRMAASNARWRRPR